MIEIARGADARIMNFIQACRATLLHNFRREIDLVMRRANTRAELRDDIRSACGEPIRHHADRPWHNAELRPFSS